MLGEKIEERDENGKEIGKNREGEYNRNTRGGGKRGKEKIEKGDRKHGRKGRKIMVQD